MVMSGVVWTIKGLHGVSAFKRGLLDQALDRRLLHSIYTTSYILNVHLQRAFVST